MRRRNPVSAWGQMPQPAPADASNHRIAFWWWICSSSQSATSTLTSRRNPALLKVFLKRPLYHFVRDGSPLSREKRNAVGSAADLCAGRRGFCPTNQLSDGRAKTDAACSGVSGGQLVDIVIKIDVGAHASSVHQIINWCAFEDWCIPTPLRRMQTKAGVLRPPREPDWIRHYMFKM